MKYNRTEIAENIGFSTVIDEKFKTAQISVKFITELDGKTSAENTVGIGILTTTNGKIKTIAEMTKKLSSLYGASISSSSTKTGDLQILGVSASWIVNEYAIDGEDIEGEMLGIVRDSIFFPDAENGSFNPDTFKIEKKELLDRIEAEINNKRGYALAKGGELAYKGEPAEFSAYGNKESAEAVTPQTAYRAYLNILKTAQVEIMYVSPHENSAFEEMFREYFGKTERCSRKNTFRAVSPVKSEIAELSEEMDVRQCKMVMNFKSDSDDIVALGVLNLIYGATPVSKLFMNVREKMSLCYYCASRYSNIKNTICVDSGVEKSNIEKAKAEIIHQLEEIKNGNISDEEIQSALLALDNSLTSVGDTPSSYSKWYFDRFCSGKILTPEEYFNDYRNITKARIVQAAASMKLDSIYYMLNKEVSE